MVKHKQFVHLAIAKGADIIIFPELSLTGYEPTLAKNLAVDHEDRCFADFQTISDTNQVTIGVGVPTKSNGGICISMLLFQPHLKRKTYTKQYLHADEEPFFVSGQNIPCLTVDNTNIAIAICYELSVPNHAQTAYESGAEIYIASVAKSATGVEQAAKRLADIAKNYAMPVLMSNCIGPSEGFESAGQTAVWNHNGILLRRLDSKNEGIIIYNNDTQESSHYKGFEHESTSH